MKKLVCILLSFCSALAACNGYDPATRTLGEKRLVRPRLSSDTEWRPCCARPKIRETCPERIDSREEALELLTVAGGECLDRVVKAVELHSPGDRAAAYLIRAERNGEPAGLLQAARIATGFNRAVAWQRLGLKKRAIAEWEPLIKQDSAWSREAHAHYRHLSSLPDPQWNPKEIDAAVTARDRAALTKLVKAFPADAATHFERSDLLDRDGARLYAEVLAESGERFPAAVMEAMARTPDADALEQGLRAFRSREYGRAAPLLARARNPLYLAAESVIVSQRFSGGKEALAEWDALASRTSPEYRDLSFRIQILRAHVLEFEGQYLQALTAYERAAEIANGDPTRSAQLRGRRSQNYSIIGSAGRGLLEAAAVLKELHRVANLDGRQQIYTGAAMAAAQLGYPDVALEYQKEWVDECRKKRGAQPDELNHRLAAALRQYADFLVAAGRETVAKSVLIEASALAQEAKESAVRALLQMRLQEVNGQALLKEGDPRAAVAAFSEAIEMAAQQDSTHRAVLHFNRAAAWRAAGEPQAAADDTTAAMTILRDEANGLVDTTRRGEYERFWHAYFSRFEEMHHQVIRRRLDTGDVAGAFLHAEQTRAFEPLQLVLRSRSLPPGFRPIETLDDLEHHLRDLPEDTVILHYVVMPDRTYTWVLVRGNISVFPQRTDRETIGRWVAQVNEAVQYGQPELFKGTMRAAYAQLFLTPLASASSKTRVVIVPDGPMHGLPFAGLESVAEGHLIERASIAAAGSTSLYLYALARDRQLSANRHPSILIVGNPASHPLGDLKPLPHAQQEAEELASDEYRGAHLLTGAAATVERFLALAKGATLIHFAGHGIANPQQPWTSRLILAATKSDSGELSAERLMQELSELERTRLVVLGACSTAGGHPVGPQGLAPLVRPLIAANVPAVVGTLWDVNDATAKHVLGSLHCHHRRGDDVAVALRNAQLERLRDKEPAMTWAPFQVVGYAGSPYARPVASEETRSDHVCTEDSLQRPHGLHSQ